METYTTWAGVEIELTRAHNFQWFVGLSGRKTAVKRLLEHLLDGVPEHEYRQYGNGVLLVRHNALWWFAMHEPAFSEAFREAMRRPWPIHEPVRLAVIAARHKGA